MSTSRLVHHAHLVWRSERVIAELRLKRLLGNLGLQAFAALVLTFALLSFEVAAYFALVQVWSASGSAAILGLCNLVIAGAPDAARHAPARKPGACARERGASGRADRASRRNSSRRKRQRPLRCGLRSKAPPSRCCCRSFRS